MFDILECEECGVRVTHPHPPEREMARYYESGEYMPHSADTAGIIPFLYDRVRKITLARKRRLVGGLASSTPGTLLDVGCGTGEFLNTMHRAGWEVEGVESSERAREKAKKTYDLPVLAPERWMDENGPKYDTVTLWHSLEHLHRLDRYLPRLRDALKETGHLFAAVPNFRSLDAEFYRAFWAAYDAPRHLYHFDSRSLTALFQKYSFHVTRIVRLPFDSFYVSMLSEKNGGGSLIRGGWVGLKSYFEALPDPTRASSILFILKKGG